MALADGIAGVVLAAGRSTRFGRPKLAVALDGRPLIRHVLEAAVAAGLDPIVVVSGPDDALTGIDLRPARRVVNPHPEEGLSSSVRLGLQALRSDVAIRAAVILLGYQPLVRPSTIRELIAASAGQAPLVVPAYSDDDAPNPMVARRDAWRLADELAGDRGFAPILLRHPELVQRVPIDGSNPDVDTPRDLATLEARQRRAGQ
jgi:molybdenum cofactor cytidylyltransferase